MNNPVENLIEVIKTGSPEEVKEAQKRVEKFWHEVYIPKREEGRKAFSIFLEEIKKIEEIKDINHQSLNGKSPEQMIKEAMQKQPEPEEKSNQKMPDFIVGGQKIPWDEYWTMMAEMEKSQVPFRNWVKNDLSPKYEQYLKNNFSPDTSKKHKEVAEIFFDRAMHIGFIEFDEIRRDFIHKEFPEWWQTHVLISSLTEKEVLSSLRELFRFLALTYNIDIGKFGF